VLVSNTGDSDATNVKIEFNSEGSLPSFSPVVLPEVKSGSDTVVLIHIPVNTGNTVLSGYLRAEITGCDNFDMNPLTVYGSWKTSNWTGVPEQADEFMLNLTIYPEAILTGTLRDTICSGAIFAYEPESNVEGAAFSWTRHSVAGIDENFAAGTGSISERLTNIFDSPVLVRYEYILTLSESCQYSDTAEVLVNPVSRLKLSHYPSEGESIVIGAPVTIVSETEGARGYLYTYITDNGKETVINGQNDINEYKIYEYEEDATNTVEVRVMNEYGCESFSTESFAVNYHLPNIITPKSNSNTRLLKGRYIEVFNRMGSEIYRGKDGWDGTYKGALVASAMYLYVLYIDLPDGSKTVMKKAVFVKY
jgi:hypothetical protein